MDAIERKSAAQAARNQSVDKLDNVEAKLKESASAVINIEKQLADEEASRQAAITSDKPIFLKSLNSIKAKLSDARTDVVSYTTAKATLNRELAAATRELDLATVAEREVRRRAAIRRMAAVLRGPFREAHDELLGIWQEEPRGDGFLLVDKVLLDGYLAAADEYVAGPKPPLALPKGHTNVTFVRSFSGSEIVAPLRHMLPYSQGETASFPDHVARELTKAGFCVVADKA